MAQPRADVRFSPNSGVKADVQGGPRGAKDHLLRRVNVFVTVALDDLHKQLSAYYSDIGRPSVDPELMIRMLIVGYCYGIRHERRLCEEVKLHLGYRWFCKLDLTDKVPHHSTFSINRLERFRDSDILRHVFERVVAACMAEGLVKGEGFAVDASVMEANASRYRGKAPDELEWTDAQRQKRAVAEYLAGLEAEGRSPGEADGGKGGGDSSEGERQPRPDRKPPKVISLSDPSSAWTAKANKRVQFGYGLNYLIDVEHAVIVDVEATPARTYDEVAATRTMIERTQRRFDLTPKRLAADTAYGTGKFLAFVVSSGIIPHIPVWDMSKRDDGTFSRSEFSFDSRRNIYICPAGKTLTTNGKVHSHQRTTRGLRCARRVRWTALSYSRTTVEDYNGRAVKAGYFVSGHARFNASGTGGRCSPSPSRPHGTRARNLRGWDRP